MAGILEVEVAVRASSQQLGKVKAEPEIDDGGLDRSWQLCMLSIISIEL